MADENRIALTVAADTASLKDGMEDAVAAVQLAMARMKDTVAGATGAMSDMAGQIQTGFVDAFAGAGEAATGFGKVQSDQRAQQVKDEARIAQDQLALSQAALQRKKATGEISAQDELQGLRELARMRFDIVQQELERETELNGGHYTAGVLKQEAAAWQKYALQIEKLNTRAAAATKSAWQQAMQPVAASLESSIKGMILGTTSLQRAMANLGQAVLGQFVDLGVKTVTGWIATEAAKTAATAAGAAERGTIEGVAAEQSIALTVATGIKDIAVKAYQAAAGAYAAIAAIPYVGPVLAPVAAAGALAAVAAFGKSIASAEGGWGRVPGDQLAQLHKDEMVLPASLAERLRNMSDPATSRPGAIAPPFVPSFADARPSASLGGVRLDASGEMHTHLHVHAIDTRSGAEFLLSNMSTIARGLAREMRHFNPAFRFG